MKKTAKYTWKDHKTNKDALSGLKINPVEKKIQNYNSKLVQYMPQMDTITLNYEITTMWET